MHDSCSFAGGTIIDDLSEHAGYVDIVENKLKKTRTDFKAILNEELKGQF
jgi:hypothetical protein